jgi:hypothetical protein
MFAEYNRETGLLVARTRDGGTLFRGNGYAGYGDGRNNPTMSHLRNVGPLPAGVYRIHVARPHPRLGPNAMPLLQVCGESYGRSDFWIHGDNVTGNASRGCIVLGPGIRHEIEKVRVSVLIVR